MTTSPEHLGPSPSPTAALAGRDEVGLIRKVASELVRQPSVVVAVVFLLAVGALGMLAPMLDVFDPSGQDLTNTLAGPSWDHPLGTDEFGRDLLSRVIYGGRVALLASLQGITLAFVLGVPLGALAGYLGGWVDRVVGWIVDLFMSLPGLLVAFVVIAVLGTGLRNAMIGVGIVLATPYARLVRSVVLSEREALYVDAAQVTGLRRGSILIRHIFPNVAPAIIVQTSVLIGAVILIEASLSFLGLGAPINVPSWGRMLSQARFFVLEQPFFPWPPGLAIALTVLAFNVIGDGLRDALGGLDRSGAERPSARRARRRRRAAARRAATSRRRGEPNGIDVAPRQGCPPGVNVHVEDLCIGFDSDDGPVRVVDGVSLEVFDGETLGLVGESGSGKSLTAYAILGLLPDAAEASGEVWLRATEVLAADAATLARVRGRDVSMIFQEPGRALNPAMRVGDQVAAPARRHLGLSRAAARRRAVELLEQVGLSDPATRARQFPHEFSGGMAQRVVIARALASRPSVLLADEPTTALDVSVQAQILDLLRDVRDRFDTSLLFITHDLGIAADICDRVAVMYAGQLVEVGTVDQVITDPRHPYTKMLLAASPDAADSVDGWVGIEGSIPAPGSVPVGCRFAPRCPLATEACIEADVALDDLDGTLVRCVRADEMEVRLWGPTGVPADQQESADE